MESHWIGTAAPEYLLIFPQFPTQNKMSHQEALTCNSLIIVQMFSYIYLSLCISAWHVLVFLFTMIVCVCVSISYFRQ